MGATLSEAGPEWRALWFLAVLYILQRMGGGAAAATSSGVAPAFPVG